jgi:hypothetical protein
MSVQNAGVSLAWRSHRQCQLEQYFVGPLLCTCAAEHLTSRDQYPAIVLAPEVLIGHGLSPAERFGQQIWLWSPSSRVAVAPTSDRQRDLEKNVRTPARLRRHS